MANAFKADVDFLVQVRVGELEWVIHHILDVFWQSSLPVVSVQPFFILGERHRPVSMFTKVKDKC